MQILTTSSHWLKSQIATPGDDFRQGPETSKAHAGVGAAVGAGVGAAAGGGLAYHSVSNDSTYFDYVTQDVPLAASGPDAASVFGQDLAGFQSLVAGHSDNTTSSQETLRYLSYLKFQNPQASVSDIQGIYRSLESQFGNDNQVRQALNMVSAHVQKHGTSPNVAYGEFSNHFGYETDFSKAAKTFAEDHKIGQDDLTMTTVQMVKRHTSPLGHLGTVKAIALGVAAGAAVGAVTGLVVGVGISLYKKAVTSGS